MPRHLFIRFAVNYSLYTWATTWQNQQNECAPSEDSDQPDAQDDLSLHWAHSHFVGFVMSRLTSPEHMFNVHCHMVFRE